VIKHSIADLLLAHTVNGTIMFGIISKIQESSIDAYHNLYDIMWLGKNAEESAGQYTYSAICHFKNNLEEYLYDYGKV
jgi:hypothetical protein